MRLKVSFHTFAPNEYIHVSSKASSVYSTWRYDLLIFIKGQEKIENFMLTYVMI